MAAGQTSAPGVGWINIAIFCLGGPSKDLSQYIQDRLRDGALFLSDGDNLMNLAVLSIHLIPVRRTVGDRCKQFPKANKWPRRFWSIYL
jgi:hypothetical protein